ncbi:unnamed protein product, partial [Scytosiphon promiscuus]
GGSQPRIYGRTTSSVRPLPPVGTEARVMRLCLSVSYFLITRSDDMFGDGSGVPHPVHCLTRQDIVFFAGKAQLPYARWQQADKIEIRLRGHKGDQEQIGRVGARTRDKVHGPQSGYLAESGAVASTVELMSCHPTLPDHAPLSSFRSGRDVKVLEY